MENPTHFVEIFAPKNRMFNKTFMGVCQPISMHDFCIGQTKKSDTLFTVAVWKIKEKPSAVIASRDGEVNATIIEKV